MLFTQKIQIVRMWLKVFRLLTTSRCNRNYYRNVQKWRIRQTKKRLNAADYAESAH